MKIGKPEVKINAINLNILLIILVKVNNRYELMVK